MFVPSLSWYKSSFLYEKREDDFTHLDIAPLFGGQALLSPQPGLGNADQERRRRGLQREPPAPATAATSANRKRQRETMTKTIIKEHVARPPRGAERSRRR